jgi:hypothetical protein
VKSRKFSGTREPFSSFPFSLALEVPTRAIRQEKEIKAFQIGKEEEKLFLFANEILCKENSKYSSEKY